MGLRQLPRKSLAGSIELMGCKFVQVYGLTETTGGVPFSEQMIMIRVVPEPIC